MPWHAVWGRRMTYTLRCLQDLTTVAGGGTRCACQASCRTPCMGTRFEHEGSALAVVLRRLQLMSSQLHWHLAHHGCLATSSQRKVVQRVLGLWLSTAVSDGAVLQQYAQDLDCYMAGMRSTHAPLCSCVLCLQAAASSVPVNDESG